MTSKQKAAIGNDNRFSCLPYLSALNCLYMGCLKLDYYDESGVSGMNLFGADYYYRKNILGDITELYRSDGVLAGSYTYDAWGNTTVTSDPLGVVH